MVDKSLLLRKLAELEEYHRQIREYAVITLEQYSQESVLLMDHKPFI